MGSHAVLTCSQLSHFRCGCVLAGAVRYVRPRKSPSHCLHESGSEAELLVSWQDLSATVLLKTLTQSSQDMEELYTLLLVAPL